MPWTPIPLDGAVVSPGVDGLVCLEELKDYSLQGTSIKWIVEGAKEAQKGRKRKREVREGTNRKRRIVRREKEKRKAKQRVRRTEEKESQEEDGKDDEAAVGSLQGDAGAVVQQPPESEMEDGSGLEGMEAWSGLKVPSPVLRALLEMGFKEPTEIQLLSLPPAIMGRRDILGAAETGSGKTLAFGIPIIYGILQQKKKESGLLEEDRCSSSEEEGVGGIEHGGTLPTPGGRKLYALVLTPTRELAIQVRNHLVAVAKYTGIKVAVVVGGLTALKQERLLKKQPEIVVATPGRLWELVHDGNSHLSTVNDIRFLAIDETDRMLEKGHFEELHKLLERINIDAGKKKTRQNFVFSATLTLVHEPPKYTKKGKGDGRRVTPGEKLQELVSVLGITDPKVVDITRETATAGTLQEARILCALEEKDFYLYYFLRRHHGRTLVFCNSIGCVRRLAQLLNLLQCRPLPLHANMVQRQRLKNLERFRDDPNGLLLATDVAARGLDIPGVQHVVHYQVPRTSESYVHRSGRTARAKKEGLALLLVEPLEVPFYTRVCRTLGRERDLPTFPVEDVLFRALRERVALAQELDRLELASRRVDTGSRWLEKAVKDMDLHVEDDDDMPLRKGSGATAEAKKKAPALRKRLAVLLEKPLILRGFSGKYPTQTGQLVVPFQEMPAKEVHTPGAFVRRRPD